jgi:hypothetical protein
MILGVAVRIESNCIQARRKSQRPAFIRRPRSRLASRHKPAERSASHSGTASREKVASAQTRLF